jgi:hypothetical protein
MVSGLEWRFRSRSKTHRSALVLDWLPRKAENVHLATNPSGETAKLVFNNSSAFPAPLAARAHSPSFPAFECQECGGKRGSTPCLRPPERPH